MGSPAPPNALRFRQTRTRYQAPAVHQTTRYCDNG